MAILSGFSLELGLGGSFFRVVQNDHPLAFWLLNEQLIATGARDSAGSNHGTYIASPTLGVPSPFPLGGTALRLSSGLSQYVTMGDVAAFEFTGAFTVAFMFRRGTAAASTMGLVTKCTVGGQGWGVWMTSTGTINFLAFSSVPAAVFNISTPSEYDDSAWHHCVCTWDGTTGANKVRIYIDGTLEQSGTAVAGTPATNTSPFYIGAIDNGGTPGNFFGGDIAGVVVDDAEFSSVTVTAHYAATQWTDVSEDVVLASPGLSLEYGTAGVKPLDRLANAGSLEFALRNDPGNSAGIRGYYSPLHANCRPGFTFDIPVRVQMTFAAVTYTKFWGRVAVIDPTPGVHSSQTTVCLAHDYMFLLNDTDVRSVTAQLGQTDVDLIRSVFDAMPVDMQPIALDLDPNVDTFTYAFDDLRGGRKASTILSKILFSSWGRGFVSGAGTFAYRNRDASTNPAILATLDDDMNGLQSPSDRSNVFDIVRVITHPKSIDAAATSILFSHPLQPFVAANGGTMEIWPEEGYRNPNNDAMTIGGTDMVTPVSGTDFIANTAADGSGTNRTASVTVTASFFASTVKLTLTNNHATDGVYFTTLQVRGKGIYDLAPVTSEALGDPATRPITVDLPYQDDENVGQEIADFILNEREAITDPVESVSFNPHRSDAMMTLALAGEPGEVMVVTETQTGLDEAQAAIRSIHLGLKAGLILTATFGLTPIVVGYEWILDHAEFSELDETTVFG